VRFGEAVPARPSKLLELEALSATISDHSQSFEYVTSLSVPCRGLHGSDIHMDIHMVMDKCWIWIGFYRIDGYG